METYFDYTGETREWHGEYLPHYEVDGGIYFVTFSLFDAAARRALLRLRDDRQARLGRLYERGQLTMKRRRLIDAWHLLEVDRLFDAGNGSRLLQRPDVAAIVREALQFFHRERYDLLTWVLMPTHVHVGLQMRLGHWLTDSVHSWKSYTANKINALLNRGGEPVWFPDYYDRLVRTHEELERVREYIWSNPDAAGLADWPWRRDHGLTWREDREGSA